METITFTPKAEICKGFRCLAKGLKYIAKGLHAAYDNSFSFEVVVCHLIAKGLHAAYDNSLHKYPYAHLYLLFFVMTLIYVCCVGKTRAERDSLSKENYKLREQIDSIQSANGIKEVRTIYED